MYGLRIDLSVVQISLLLTAFSIGAIVFQLPLGMISDKFGRRRTLVTILIIGTTCFSFASILEAYLIGLIICLFLAGMAVGSTFSLGISYMTDLVPTNLLPTGNLLCGMAFSVGSLIGPYLGGVFIQYFQHISYFIVIAAILFVVCSIIFIFGKKNREIIT